ncbi:hypothetical protein ACFQMA_18500 [Halosimplex aquaticum]|uniref:DUF8165 domain-containing protein n=1 Tax=Halosimplex aquaticum TaxID=3026162 RepID=A0ABD5Y8F7_9EURY|nr:hypothetical protein [Halosimplex aquaticum]
MLKGHFTSAGASIDYGDATGLFPVDELDSTVLQHRDAQLALDDVDGADVIIIAPTSLATSYLLTQHALTTIPVDSLPAATQGQLGEKIEEPLDTFDLIQVGKWNTDSPNHSLAEFTNA